MKESINKMIIGRNVRVSVPLLGLSDFFAKVDTGAYRTSIHCYSIKEKLSKDKKTKVLVVRPIGKDYELCKFEEYGKIQVRNSTGHIEERYLIDSVVELNNVMVNAPITLSDRSDMKTDILLGRTFLKGNFLVDVSLFEWSVKDGKKKR